MANGSVVNSHSESAPHSFGVTVGLLAAFLVLTVTAFPPFNIWPLAFVCFVPWVWAILGARSLRRAVLLSFFTHLILWLWFNRWIIPITLPGYPALSLYMALAPAFFAWLLYRTARSQRLGWIPLPILIATLWTGMEMLRGTVAFDGYPWYLLGQPLIEAPILVQSADLFGTYFITFLAALAAGAVVMLVPPGFGARRLTPRGVAVTITLVLAVHAANIVYGAFRLAETQPLRDGPAILAIQTNLPQDNKIGWLPDAQVRDFATFVQLTRKAVAEARQAGHHIDLVAWPETMLPGVGLEPQAVRTLVEGGYIAGSFALAITELQRELGIPLLVGSPAWIDFAIVDGRGERSREYNSAYLLRGDRAQERYDKFFLTPFGETMPYISNWPWLERQMLDLGARGMSFNLSSNPDIHIFSPADPAAPSRLPAFATPICFEDTVAAVCRRMVWADAATKRAPLLVNLSNDGWFTDYDECRSLHAQLARFRCIENRVPMVRVANTGYSLAFDSCGRITHRIGSGRYGESRQAGSLLATVKLDARVTLYGRIGDLFAWLCLAISLLLVIVVWAGGSRNQPS